MSQLNAYDEIISGTSRDLYRIIVAVPEPVDVEARLVEAGYRVETGDDELVVRDDRLPHGRCELSCESGGFEDPEGRDLARGDIEALAAAQQRIGIDVMLGPDWQAGVRAIAVLVDRIVPEFMGMYDFDAFTFWSSRWLRAVAGGRPITLSELFDIHGVSDAGVLWAHTHGLRRLGLIELELRGELDTVSLEFAGNVINATANVMFVAGVPPPETGFRVGTETMVEWEPWEAVEWGDDELGGPDDRDEYHSGASGVLFPSADGAPLLPGVRLDDTEDGWAVPADAIRIFEDLARATAAAAYEQSRARAGRSMWLSAGSLSGDVLTFDGSSFRLAVEEGIGHASVPLDVVDSWWVSCDEGSYSLGPWKAHNLPVIEELADLRRAAQDSDGRPLCSGCGKPLVGEHTCG